MLKDDIEVIFRSNIRDFIRVVICSLQEGVAVGGRKDGHSALFKHLKAAVKHQCEVNHAWQASAHENLVFDFLISRLIHQVSINFM